ncbi:MAG: MinD/ParA family protein [Calditrichaeota bacterium]|nr:MAG: MinD/ParA family protein [Calditrichota bacterium]MBL1204024.1 MinD/ParA family protein [Calditrichota bacterium]NOG43855.1 MinD/ParA family protein [Calditrichota bacterium]
MLTTLGKEIGTRIGVEEGSDQKKAEIIAITSGKGGVGKSSLSVNFAIMLQQMRKRVLIIDADIHLGNVDLILGIRTEYTIADVLNDGIALSDIIVPGPSNIDVLPASSASGKLLEMEDVFLKRLAVAFKTIETDYDYIIVDTGAGIANSVLSFLLGADKIVLVITSDPASIADAYAVIKIIKRNDLDIPIMLIPNIMPSHEAGENLYKRLNLMVRRFLKSDIEFAGTVLKDDLIARSIKMQKPFVINSPNAAATNTIRVLTKRVLQMEKKKQKDNKNVFDRFISNRKIKFEWD